MSDIVNDYFKRFYPPLPLDQSKMEFDGHGFEYTDRSVSRIFPEMECSDGFTLSVQGHAGGYSHPRDDFADKYTTVEVWNLSAEEPLLIEWDRERGHGENEPNRGEWPYGYVPISVVVAVIEKHGGLKP